MKKFIKDFCVRGLMFAWGGPVIMAIVWLWLKRSGEIEELAVEQAALGIISTTFLAFIAAGVSVVHQMENLPRLFAALIQASVLYIDYLGIYLLNSWIPVEKIWLFTLIFAVCFILIWTAIYIPIRIRISKINRTLK